MAGFENKLSVTRRAQLWEISSAGISYIVLIRRYTSYLAQITLLFSVSFACSILKVVILTMTKLENYEFMSCQSDTSSVLVFDLRPLKIVTPFKDYFPYIGSGLVFTRQNILVA